jgi:hypothetical protein
MLERAVLLPYCELVSCVAKDPVIAIPSIPANMLQVYLTFLERIEDRRTKMRI